MIRGLTILFIVFPYFFKTQSLTFRENKNQWPRTVQFSADLPAGQLFIESDGFTWKLFNEADLHALHREKDPELSKQIVHGHNFQVKFRGAFLKSPKTSDKTSEYYNYFFGSDPARWASNVNGYGIVEYKNVYRNIDLKLYSEKKSFKYDFILRKGADVSEIQMEYLYAENLTLSKGRLNVETSIGTITESIPEAYQVINGKKSIVPCEYVLKNNLVSFRVLNFDTAYDLIIDPAVVVSSFSGTESISFALGLIPDENGNMYLSSMNLTKHYPVTMGAVQLSWGGGVYDCTVSKFDKSGSNKIFSTYIGGNKEELILNLAANNNEIGIFGYTLSDTFPIVQSGFQNVYGGSRDYFIIKIDSSGKQLLSSTYLGGKRQEGIGTVSNGNRYYADNIGEMTMDKNGNCYILGVSISVDYPVTTNCIKCFSDSSNFGDLVLSKLNSTLSDVIWSTYLGGKYGESPGAIIFSRDGNLLCAGNTTSFDFPTTGSVLSNTKSVSTDIVLFKMNSGSGALMASTYVPLKSNEMAYRIADDINDNVYVAGSNNSPASLTVTPGAYNNNTGNILFLKMNAAFSQLDVLSKFGYSNPQTRVIEIDAFNVDSCGNIYFGGFGLPGLPVTPDAFKTTGETYGSLYVGIFNPGFSSLKFGTYYGSNGIDNFGDHDDGGLNYLDKRGNFYHGVCVPASWPVTAGAYSGFNITDSIGPPYNNFTSKNSDAFVKFDLQTFVNANSTLGGEIKSCSPITVTLAASPNLGTTTIIPGDGSAAVNSQSLAYTYSVHGVYNALIIAGTDTSTCNHSDSIRIKIAFGQAPEKPLNDQANLCVGSKRKLDAKNPGSSYLWNTGENTQIIFPETEGTYMVFINNYFCTVSDTIRLKKLDAKFPMILPNIISPNNDGINDVWPFYGHAVTSICFELYNRWGNLVFKSNEPESLWRGTNQNGEPLSEGTYFWIIDYISDCEPEQNIKEKGFIQVVH